MICCQVSEAVGLVRLSPHLALEHLLCLRIRLTKLKITFSCSFSLEISVSLLSVIVTFCGIVLLSVSLFVSWKLCWLPWRDNEGGGLSLTSGLLPGTAGVGGLGTGGSSLLPSLLQRKEGHSSSSLYPSLGQQSQHHPHFADLVGLERGEIGGVGMGPTETQEPSYLDMDSCHNNAGEKRSPLTNISYCLFKSRSYEMPHLVTYLLTLLYLFTKI